MLGLGLVSATSHVAMVTSIGCLHKSKLHILNEIECVGKSNHIPTKSVEHVVSQDHYLTYVRPPWRESKCSVEALGKDQGTQEVGGLVTKATYSQSDTKHCKDCMQHYG